MKASWGHLASGGEVGGLLEEQEPANEDSGQESQPKQKLLGFAVDDAHPCFCAPSMWDY